MDASEHFCSKRSFEELLLCSSSQENSSETCDLDQSPPLIEDNFPSNKQMRLNGCFNYSGNFQGKIFLRSLPISQNLSSIEKSNDQKTPDNSFTNIEYLRINAYLKEIHLESCRRKGL